jgi:hypothetical protein
MTRGPRWLLGLRKCPRNTVAQDDRKAHERNPSRIVNAGIVKFAIPHHLATLPGELARDCCLSITSKLYNRRTTAILCQAYVADSINMDSPSSLLETISDPYRTAQRKDTSATTTTTQHFNTNIQPLQKPNTSQANQAQQQWVPTLSLSVTCPASLNSLRSTAGTTTRTSPSVLTPRLRSPPLMDHPALSSPSMTGMRVSRLRSLRMVSMSISLNPLSHHV